MSNVVIPYRYLTRGGTAANLAAVNEVPLARELVIETDTGFFKIGDGSTAYNSLPYAGIYPAELIPYDNTTSGLTATDAQAAIDELAAGGGAGGSSDGFDSSLVTFAHNDFTVLTEWTSTGAGTASGASAANAAGRAGIVDLTTGTSTTGFRYYHDPAGLAFYLGGGAEIELIYGFKIPALSDGTNRFSFLAGLTDNVASASSNRLALRYSDDVNSGNWTIRSNVGSTTGTDVTGSFGPTAGTWYRARIVINAAGTSADVYVKAEGAAEQLVGTTTAVPSAVMYNVLSIAKMTGATARSVLCDFATRRHRYSAPR